MLRLYELLAYDSQRSLSFAALCFRSKVIRLAVADVLLGALAKFDMPTIEDNRHLVLQGMWRVRFELGICSLFEGRNLGWKVRLRGGSSAPVPLIAVRLQEHNLEILDYVLFDRCPVRKESFRLSEASVNKCLMKGTAEQVTEELILRLKQRNWSLL